MQDPYGGGHECRHHTDQLPEHTHESTRPVSHVENADAGPENPRDGFENQESVRLHETDEPPVRGQSHGRRGQGTDSGEDGVVATDTPGHQKNKKADGHNDQQLADDRLRICGESHVRVCPRHGGRPGETPAVSHDNRTHAADGLACRNHSPRCRAACHDH